MNYTRDSCFDEAYSTPAFVMDLIFDLLSYTQLLAVGGTALAAALLRAFTGFGFAMIAVPIFSLLLLPSEAVVLAASLTIAVSTTSYKEWWGKFPIDQFRPMFLGSLAGTTVGVYLLSGMSKSDFQLWIGLSVIAATLVTAFVKPLNRVRVPKRLTVGTGVASGLMNGAFAIPGPPVVVYAMSVIGDAAAARAFLMAFFYASNLLGLVMFTVAGMVTMVRALLFLLTFPLTLLGDKTGIALFNRFGSASYRPVALIVATALGCWNVYSGLA